MGTLQSEKVRLTPKVEWTQADAHDVYDVAFKTRVFPPFGVGVVGDVRERGILRSATHDRCFVNEMHPQLERQSSYISMDNTIPPVSGINMVSPWGGGLMGVVLGIGPQRAPSNGK